MAAVLKGHPSRNFEGFVIYSLGKELFAFPNIALGENPAFYINRQSEMILAIPARA
jgi:hypothetical protein